MEEKTGKIQTFKEGDYVVCLESIHSHLIGKVCIIRRVVSNIPTKYPFRLKTLSEDDSGYRIASKVRLATLLEKELAEC